jgi:hypothetical protein
LRAGVTRIHAPKAFQAWPQALDGLQVQPPFCYRFCLAGEVLIRVLLPHRLSFLKSDIGKELTSIFMIKGRASFQMVVHSRSDFNLTKDL